MTAALASAAATTTMVSGSSGLAAARQLSRTFLRESGRGSVFLTSAVPGPAKLNVLPQAMAGPPGRDLGPGEEAEGGPHLK